MNRRHDRLQLLAIVFAFAALGACDDGSGGAARDGDVETSQGPLSDAGPDAVPEIADAGPESREETTEDTVEEAEIRYPGNECGGDNQCSTGLCYGIATPQGAFEAPRCQTLCLALSDFGRYCDSDDDCCKGRCCLGCGAQEGLCVID